MHVAQHVTRDFFNHIGIGRLRGEKGDITLELVAHRFETFDFEVEKVGAFQKTIARFQAVTAMKRMIPEVSTGCQAGKQHQHLADSGPSSYSGIMRIGTQHGLTGLSVEGGSLEDEMTIRPTR